MSSKSYTALGWVVWQIGSRVAKRKLAQNRSKLIAAGVVAAVVAAGIALASNDDDE
ncbi:MAG TPA: hypothetical protein VHF90_02095 [Thermoleophilaceae bacterium]|nr:hypothetical protein [Thermoleophilaceae bacterium]